MPCWIIQKDISKHLWNVIATHLKHACQYDCSFNVVFLLIFCALLTILRSSKRNQIIARTHKGLHSGVLCVPYIYNADTTFALPARSIKPHNLMLNIVAVKSQRRAFLMTILRFYYDPCVSMATRNI